MASTDRGVKEQLTAAAQMLQSVAKPMLDLLTVAVPFIMKYSKMAHEYYMKLPQNALLFIYGFVFCFFGGTFPTLFAAIQAAEYSGRQTFMNAISDLADEAIKILQESEKDNKVDADKDGKADVNQISSAEFVQRKVRLVLRKMNPEKVDKAIGALYKVWLAVAAVLSVEFAKTISMALAIAEFIRKPLNRFVAPTIQMAVPDEYDKWVPVVLAWIAKSIAMSIAFFIQSFVSGVASALKGGLMMAHATYHALRVRNMIQEVDLDKSKLDEALSYVFAALGFYTQLRSGFTLPTPLNILLWPFQLAEYYIRWSIIGKAKTG